MSEQALSDLERHGVRANPFIAGRRMPASRKGMAATAHPTATLAAIDVLRDGGSAADAAIAAAAVLAVVEPAMTGMGGDAFFLYYDANSKKISGLNGSGRSPRGLGLEEFARAVAQGMYFRGWPSVTVPGAVDAWCSLHERHGSLSLSALLAPAIALAEQGYVVGERVARDWADYHEALANDPVANEIYLLNGRPPQFGEMMVNPRLAESLKLVAAEGRDAFYQGPIAAKIADYAAQTGGYLTREDFAEHSSTWVEPVHTSYRDHEVWQLPPNGQGLGVLLMLNILEGYDLPAMEFNSPDYLHLLIEAKKLAYADLHTYIADPDLRKLPIEGLLAKAYSTERRALIDPAHAADSVDPGLPKSGDTTYLTVADEQGNAVSFINSVYAQFGSGVAGGDTGILLQNRGAGFSAQPDHLNCYAPGKRPFHTIIPGMVTKDGRLYMSYGLMGGPIQPQGHVQFLLAHLDHGLPVQEAIDVPRWFHVDRLDLLMEHGTPRATMDALRAKGHAVQASDFAPFGGAQAIVFDQVTGSYIGASDPRKDGLALGV